MPTRESHPHGMPSWCDMSSRDIEVAKAFYGAVFGWEMHTAPEPEAGGYTMALLKGRAAAAITPQQQEQVEMGIPPHWTMYFTVDDVDAMAAKVEAVGGSVMAPPFDVMTAGRMTVAVTCWSPWSRTKDPSAVYAMRSIFWKDPTALLRHLWCFRFFRTSARRALGVRFRNRFGIG